jgi:hypothetical protein
MALSTAVSSSGADGDDEGDGDGAGVSMTGAGTAGTAGGRLLPFSDVDDAEDSCLAAAAEGTATEGEETLALTEGALRLLGSPSPPGAELLPADGMGPFIIIAARGEPLAAIAAAAAAVVEATASEPSLSGGGDELGLTRGYRA